MRWNKIVPTIGVMLCLGITSGDPFVVESIDSTQINLSKLEGRRMIVLWSSPACTSCKKDLSDFINELPSSKLALIGLARVPNSALIRRECINRMREIYNDTLHVYFDIIKERDTYPALNIKGGVFGKYNIRKTPAILLMNDKNDFEFICFDSLFSNKGISQTSRQKIRQFTTIN